MKMRFICVLLIAVVVASCAKSIADEPGFYDPNFHLRSTGSSAKELLTDTVFKSLKIEVQYMEGAKPSEETLKNLKNFLTKHTHKPKGIDISVTEIPAPQDTIYTLQRVMQIEDEHRGTFTSQGELAIYVLFANGDYFNHKLLGYAYRNTSLVIFGSHIAENAALYKKHSRVYLESRVLQHEFGHLMGLVNTGTPLHDDNHHDGANGKHCTNKKCLMYYLVDTEDYPLILIKQEPPGLDKHCLADLKAFGGK